MKIKRILSAFLASILLCTCFAFTANVSAASLSDFYQKYDFYGADFVPYSGLVHENTGTVTGSKYAVNSWYPGINITPNITGNPEKPLALSLSPFESLQIPLEDVDFIRVAYHYTGSYSGRAVLKMKKDDFNLTQDIVVYSMDPINKTSAPEYLTFDVKEITEGYIFEDGLLPEFEFYPFGDKPSGELTSKDIMGLTDIVIAGANSTTIQTAISNRSLIRKYPVYFLPGFADIEGTAPETIFSESGKYIVLPECTYVREGYEFTGWMCAKDRAIYQPGDMYLISTTDIDGYVTGRMYFIACWEEENMVSESVVSASAVTFFNDLVTSAANPGIKYAAKYEKGVDLDGINTVKFEIFPDASDATKQLSLDFYSWSSLPLDISKYKYVAIPYYYKTAAEKAPTATPTLNFLPTSATCLKATTSAVNTSGNIEINKWSFVTFEFDFINNPNLSKNFIANSGSNIVNQTHFRPFGSASVSQFATEGDIFYLGDFIFFEEIPETAPTFNISYISGDGDGNFRPTEIIKNAEAAAMLAKAMGYADTAANAALTTSYADITSTHWAYKYVCYLENKGILNPESGERFMPDSAADRHMFVRQVVIAKGENGDAGGDAATALASQKNTLSRAEAVEIINSLYFDRQFSADKIDPAMDKFFVDVAPDSWFYQNIIIAAMPSVSYKATDGTEMLAGLFDSSLAVPSVYTEQAVSYLEDLDAETERRIKEIRDTASEYKVKEGGKIIYLSTSTGSSSNDGTLESKPKRIKTLEEVTDLDLNPGDIVLFKRGDIFRGRMEAQSGITYSAYGTGEKPILTRSPEDGANTSKWTLDYEDKATGKKIWKYSNQDMIDVGAIMLLKETTDTVEGDPRTYEHTAAYKEVPSYRGKAILKNGTTQQYAGYYVRGYLPGQNPEYPDGKVFDYITELDRDLEFFHDTNDADNMSTPALNDSFISKTGISKLEFPNIDNATGPLYLRCDAGNPGSVYDEIEFNIRKSVLAVGTEDAVTIDNLCFMYFGTHGVSASTCNNLTVRNCEIGWGGGTIQNYNPTNASNPGFVTRLGNGVEVYGGCRNYRIDNCYVYQIYDAGITHQLASSSTGTCFMEGVYYTNNVLEKNIYNIEYFLGINTSDPNRIRFMKDIVFDGNICRMAGYGWGVQRPDSNLPSNIRAGGGNLASNYVIKNNVFDRTVDFSHRSIDSNLRVNTSFPQNSIAYFVDNIHVQTPGRIVLECGSRYLCGVRSEQDFKGIGGEGNVVYMCPDDEAEYIDSVILYQYDK